jgi:phospholipid/cholesterol/gamma-HCH transport system substrate-binding protein
METRAGYMAVGIFVLLSLLGILGCFLWLTKKDFDYKVNFYSIYFKGSVTGLSIGGPVNYRGVPVGIVKDIELDAMNLECVNITVAIKESIPIREDAYASLEMQGLTGYKFVQIYGGSNDSLLLKAKAGQKYPVIPSRYSGVEEIMTTLPRMVNKLTNLIDRLNTTFNEQNRTRFSHTLKNLEVLSQRLEESSLPLKALIVNANKAMHTLDKEIQSICFSTEKALTKVDSIAQSISNFLKDNQIALDTVVQAGSYDFLQTLNETHEMVTTAKRFFEKLDDNPRSLLFETQRTGVSVPQ